MVFGGVVFGGDDRSRWTATRAASDPTPKVHGPLRTHTVRGLEGRKEGVGREREAESTEPGTRGKTKRAGSTRKKTPRACVRRGKREERRGED